MPIYVPATTAASALCTPPSCTLSIRFAHHFPPSPSSTLAPPFRFCPWMLAISRTTMIPAPLVCVASDISSPPLDLPISRSKRPVLLFDVMGTIVRDPFYEDVPAFFGISMKELLAIKHPTAWVDFEKGVISEDQLINHFFSDRRKFDFYGLKNCMASGYAYLEGVEALLERLKSNGYQMHAFTNYPSWYQMIEEKLKLSKYLTWTFVSCHTGKRKPDPEAFIEVAKHLEISPSELIFIDDQKRNVEAARQIGMNSLAFEGAKQLEKDLITLGIVL